MSSSPEQPARPAADMLEMLRRRGLVERRLVMVSSEDLTPRMRRLTLSVAGAEPFEPRAGQDLVMLLPDGAGGLGRRHYTIRSYRPEQRQIDIDFVIHSRNTPGARWALEAKAGDEVIAFGPRGRNVIQPGADWRLFVGDETCVPAIFGMLEELPDGAAAHAIIEVADAEERLQPGRPGASIEWVLRGGAAAEPSSARLIEKLAAHPLPPGRGHVYVLGETSTIRRQRHDLLARGLDKDQIFGEGYWRPGRVGGHDHLAEH
ncbi:MULTISPECIES: siderophore-interacting protein [unclassified Phenylobacterium]|uniref:siderophore-interacting protein n=1 Tax=unclassified Phenylobacterium TaxID=2640670 RepID=UPI000A928D7F|nr:MULTISPECIES: siderophore-interacting protein [unclassified Phenylobacterium]